MNGDMEIIINGKTFGAIYFDKKPVEVKSWSITKGYTSRDGYFKFSNNCINPTFFELFKIDEVKL